LNLSKCCAAEKEADYYQVAQASPVTFGGPHTAVLFNKISLGAERRDLNEKINVHISHFLIILLNFNYTSALVSSVAMIPSDQYHRVYIGAAFVTGILVTVGLNEVYRIRNYKRESLLTKRSDEDDVILIDSVRHGPPAIVDGVEGCIGNTPLLRIKSLSEATGCEILAKAEVCAYYYY
jgi:hypothetical protein